MRHCCVVVVFSIYVRYLAQHSAHASGSQGGNQKGYGVVGKQGTVSGEKISYNSIQDKEGGTENDSPQEASVLRMLCKVSSPKESGKAEKDNQHWEHDSVAPTGFHHEKGQEQGGKGKDEGCE